MNNKLLNYAAAQINTAIAKVFSAFNSATGHAHTGDTEDGPQIDTTGLVDGCITIDKLDTTLIDDLELRSKLILTVDSSGLYVFTIIASSSFRIYVNGEYTDYQSNGANVNVIINESVSTDIIITGNISLFIDVGGTILTVHAIGNDELVKFAFASTNSCNYLDLSYFQNLQTLWLYGCNSLVSGTLILPQFSTNFIELALSQSTIEDAGGYSFFTTEILPFLPDRTGLSTGIITTIHQEFIDQFESDLAAINWECTLG